MKQWEEIIKDKMEEFDDTLPESVFAEFRARRDGAIHVPKRSRMIWAIVPAVAAGLAAILLLRQPSAPDEGIRIVRQPAPPVAQADIPAEPPVDVPKKAVVSEAVTPQAFVSSSATPKAVVNDAEPAKEPVAQLAEPAEQTAEPEEQPTERTVGPMVEQSEPAAERPKIKISPAGGAITGGGLLAAVLSSALGNTDLSTETDINKAREPYDYATSADPKDIVAPKDFLTGPIKHHSPIKTGLSVRIPVSERLVITTGLEYSLYRSSFTFSQSGENKQSVHYLGIPVRLDWTFVSRRWFDVYLGGGLAGDYCLGATFAGRKIRSDGFGLSVLGAAGAQVNLNERIGIYIEPEVSWDALPGRSVLQTYRSENPFMFSLATGLRINL
ncbi:MAG: outer membrane beta-barrel protein [Bacteroidales bacterium]|nr:outer membrane beta-barrel protein [Bacteroidales bacterium]